MKKIVALVISLVILVCGIVFQGEDASRGVIIKQGKGKSEKVTTVETLANVLDSLTDRFQSSGYTSVGGGSKIEGVAGGWFGDDENEPVEYTDAVLTFDTYGTVGMDMSSDSSYGSFSMTSNMTFDRSMTCLFTKDSAYYHVDAEIRQSASGNVGGESQSSKSFISIEAELYITEDVALMRFIEMTVLTEGFDADVKEMLGKWIDCGTGGVDFLSSINDQNYAQLSLIGDYVDEYESEGFKKSGSVYTLKDEPCKELCLDLFALAGAGSLPEDCLDTSKFRVDLSDSTTPVMDLSYVIKYDEDSQKVGGVENTRITVSDINRGNTVELPESTEIYDFSDFEDLV